MRMSILGLTKRGTLAIITASVMLLVPFLTHASGLLVSPYPDRVYQTEQEAVVFFADEKEDMILTTKFRGNADEFAWIIPTPSEPTVTRGSWETFVALRDITAVPANDYMISAYGAASGLSDFSMEEYAPAAQVIEVEQKSIAYYDVTVLEARTTEGLLEWLNTNGFSYPSDGTFVLDDYVYAGWYFTAVKLNTDSLSDSTQEDITKGNSVPLHLQFAADKPVFPLSLSQVARMYSTESPDASDVRVMPKQPDNINVTLYFITENKQSLPGFTEQYAGYISGEAISQLSYDVNGDPLIDVLASDELVMTKLYRSFPVAEMTYDLYPRDEENTNLLNDQSKADTQQLLLWGLLGFGAVLAAVLVVVIIIISKDKFNVRKQ